MASLQYTIIKNREQYDKYCDIVENLLSQEKNQDEIDLLTLLIEKWDNDHNTLNDVDPIELLKT